MNDCAAAGNDVVVEAACGWLPLVSAGATIFADLCSFSSTVLSCFHVITHSFHPISFRGPFINFKGIINIIAEAFKNQSLRSNSIITAVTSL
jgi:hypothetical protein